MDEVRAGRFMEGLTGRIREWTLIRCKRGGGEETMLKKTLIIIWTILWMAVAAGCGMNRHEGSDLTTSMVTDTPETKSRIPVLDQQGALLGEIDSGGTLFRCGRGPVLQPFFS